MEPWVPATSAGTTAFVWREWASPAAVRECGPVTRGSISNPWRKPHPQALLCLALDDPSRLPGGYPSDIKKPQDGYWPLAPVRALYAAEQSVSLHRLPLAAGLHRNSVG